MKRALRVMRFFCANNKPPNGGFSFQSKYYKPKVPVQNFLMQHNLQYKQTATGFALRECPFCMKPHNNDQSNLYKLNVHKDTGVYFCFRCASKGSWLNFRGKVLGLLTEDAGQEDLPNDLTSNGQSPFDDSPPSPPSSSSPNPSSPSFPSSHSPHPAPTSPYNPTTPLQLTQAQFMIYRDNLFRPEYTPILDYLLTQRGFTLQTIKLYKIGAGTENFLDDEGEFVSIQVVYYPMYRLYSEKERKRHENDIKDYVKAKYGGEVTVEDKKKIEELESGMINTKLACIAKMKMRGVGKENKKYMRMFPAGGVRPGIFGLNLLTSQTKEVILTEGEYDAMAAYQGSGIVALSLPQGASSLPDNVLPYLQNIQKIYLWMDNDEVGRMNCPKIAGKLGDRRTFIVQNTDIKLKDANDVLRSNPSLLPILLTKAKTIPGRSILQLDSFQQLVKNRFINADKFTGVKSSEMKFFNKKVKGLRTGELTILSGGTGSGKTTLLSQLSIDFCKQGVPTMWGSFQIKNQVLLQTMLSQFSGINLAKHVEKMDMWFGKFKELPMYFMSFFGATDLEKVFGTIEYSIEAFQVSHVVIDTLQFLLSGQASGTDKFDLQQKVMARLRHIATSHMVHISVVIHPRKTEEGGDLGIHSIFGTSKSVQEADNVWMIQLRENFKIFEIKKNRFDGELGKVALGFDKNSKKFLQLTQNQLEQLFKKTATMQQIVENRKNAVPEHQQVIDAIYKTVSADQFLERQRRRGSFPPR